MDQVLFALTLLAALGCGLIAGVFFAFSSFVMKALARLPADFARHDVVTELPSDLALMDGVLEYLQERVSKLGLIKPERSNLFVALDEAFVNAVKHGNKNDPSKLLRITAELSAKEACFTVEDQGEGFDIGQIPDPCDPANLFRTSGRGVLLIYNIMDEVEYNAQGNRIKMVKKPDVAIEAQLVEPNTPEDEHA
jgi:serine/threonine-protein kinase RsbW